MNAPLPEWQRRFIDAALQGKRIGMRSTRRGPVWDDHPSDAPHQECQVDHRGRGVARHCRCGAKWPCLLERVAGGSE